MARTINRLTSNSVKAITKVGRHADGGNLYLSISDNGGKRWTFLYRWNGKKTEIGLGSARDVKLARAREMASDYRALLAEGKNPKDSKVTAKAMPTFGEMARTFLASMKDSWKNPKRAAQWFMTLLGEDQEGNRTKFDYCAPLRPLPVDKVSTSDIHAVLLPLWSEKGETAKRIRGRIERVLGAAKAANHRSGENPARWKDNLDGLLPAQRKSTNHHKALNYAKVPDFMSRLARRTDLDDLAMSFVVQTVARATEAREAKWAEFELRPIPVTLRDEDGKEFTNMGPLWTVKPERMKEGRLHQVPLPPRVVTMLEDLRKTSTGIYVFAGPGDELLPEGAFDAVLRELGVKNDATTHGFRSSFRDWASEETNFDSNACEMALAHKVSNDVEAAYRRGQLFEKRRHIMAAWSDYCAGNYGATTFESLPQGLYQRPDGTIVATVTG